MLRILHFADAHIDMTSYGRHDPETGLPLRALDFLKALDFIVETAITEQVDLVLFAGDAYKNRTPVPTFQREWGRRVMRLSNAGIPMVMLVGNHDISPAHGRAHALQEYDTLHVPGVRVISKPVFLSPDETGLPLQLLAIPWVSRSGLLANLELNAADNSKVDEAIEERLTDLINGWLEKADPEIPIVLTAHASVQGAKYSSERSVILGQDLQLPGSLVRDQRLSYVALGHIHKAQDLNEGAQPPVIYPGSIERVDFGEAKDKKYFVIFKLDHGVKTAVEWREIQGRRFIDRFVRLASPIEVNEQMLAVLPAKEELQDAVVRLVVEYPREWEKQLDERKLREYVEGCFEFHLVRRPQTEARLRLPGDQTISSLSPLMLLEKYWKTIHVPPEEEMALQELAEDLLREADMGEVE